MKRLKLSDVCDHLLCPKVEGSFAGVAIDSREVLPGQLFVALKGQKVDGHDFVEEAFERGAACALVQEHFHKDNRPLIKVKDPLMALQKLAKWHVGKISAQVLAVTGSLGKTTTKEFLYSLLKSKYKTSCTTGNQNSQVGMAVSLLNNVEGDEEYLVVEMGMTEAGHIKKLVDIIPPHKALLTEIALVHAENFDSIDAIAKAKAEIFSHPHTNFCLISKDSPCSDLLQKLAHCKSMTYSMHDPEANFYLKVEKDCLLFNNQKLAYMHFPAPHVYQNALAALSMASLCGMTPSDLSKALPSLKLPEMRLQRIEKAGIAFINDSYNAAEPSLKASLSYVATDSHAARKIAVIGQMRELGSFSAGCHTAVGKHALECVDRVYCLGLECEPIYKVWQEANKPCFWYTDFDKLLSALKNDLQPNDLVLLKGSRSNGLWRVLDHF